MGDESARFCERVRLVESLGEPLIISGRDPSQPLCAAADHQMLGAKAGACVGDARDAAEFLLETVGEDEVRAGIGSDQFDAGPIQRAAQGLRATRMVEDVAVEQFDALIAGRTNLRDRTADIAEGEIRELTDRGDADRISAKLSPAIGLVGEANVQGRLPCNPRACCVLGNVLSRGMNADGFVLVNLNWGSFDIYRYCQSPLARCPTPACSFMRPCHSHSIVPGGLRSRRRRRG